MASTEPAVRRAARRHVRHDKAPAWAVVLAAGTSFSTKELMKHSEYDDVLGAALAAADVSNARQIGWLLKRCEGAVIEGRLKLGRDGEDKDGVVWVFRVSPEKPTRGDTELCHD
jgi:hypothetical protein